MSIGDIIWSLAGSTFQVMAPSEINYMVWSAQGNEATCNAMGWGYCTAARSTRNKPTSIQPGRPPQGARVFHLILFQLDKFHRVHHSDDGGCVANAHGDLAARDFLYLLYIHADAGDLQLSRVHAAGGYKEAEIAGSEWFVVSGVCRGLLGGNCVGLEKECANE